MTDKFEGAGPEARFEAIWKKINLCCNALQQMGHIFYPRMINPHNGNI